MRTANKKFVCHLNSPDSFQVGPRGTAAWSWPSAQKQIPSDVSKHFRQWTPYQYVSLCYFSAQSLLQGITAVFLSAFCAYTKLDISNEFRKAERQCTIKPERGPEGEIFKKKEWDRVLSYSTGSKICLLKKAIIVFICLQSTLSIQVTAWIK